MEFSAKSRQYALKRFKDETFDILIIGGGITGAAVARDAALRGLRVALVEKGDFAWGTSSRSSKLIHGGLRYLENMEFGLVHESLTERSLLIKTVPSLVRPLPFYMPVFEGDRHGKFLLGMGMWLYDALALFRSPGFHRTLSKKKFLADIPLIKSEGLKGGFRYYDATMWDDVLSIATLRAAFQAGAAVANYVEAVAPLWNGKRITGFRLKDVEEGTTVDIKMQQLVVCAGPWTDQFCGTLSDSWKPWLAPSKGVHLVFDAKKLPVKGAVVMSSPEDGRISFVIPRSDMGAGVSIVGTTDAPVSKNPEEAKVEQADIDYLMALLKKYFPGAGVSTSDILSAYIGVRPLIGAGAGATSGGALKKISREHLIAEGPGGSVVVAGGKYTTHRKMGQQIVDFAVAQRKRDASRGECRALPVVKKADTKLPVNPQASREAVLQCQNEARARHLELPPDLVSRYGADAIQIVETASGAGSYNRRAKAKEDPPGFSHLSAQLRYAMRYEMTLHLEDFYLRRQALYLSRADHGLPWAEELARTWADESGQGPDEAGKELKRLEAEVARRSAWKKQ